MKKGYLSLILHTHLPFVRHPESVEALEERWLFEAISECYLPLIESFDRLLKENIDFKITMSLTPTLIEMLKDNYLKQGYIKYLNKNIELAEKEVERTKGLAQELHANAMFYKDRYEALFKIYEEYNGDIVKAFKKFEELGYIEIICCAATHSFLPLSIINIEAVEAQLVQGIKIYKENFGHPPDGIWLPECAFTQELSPLLKKLSIKYFVCEAIAVLNASTRPIYGTYAPIVTEDGVLAFPRDRESGEQVWSSGLGYPGDVNYREFYRDIGFDLPLEYIGPYINPEGIRIDTGLKYYRITGNTQEKELYDRTKAINMSKKHAKHFITARTAQVRVANARMDKPPIITCSYDTELFGHWWFEGPDFIYEVLKLAALSSDIELISPNDYLVREPKLQLAMPNASSWGEHGDYSVWLNPSNHWIYKEIHNCQRKMLELAEKFLEPSKLEERGLNQAARELMLLEASDWAFIMKTGTTVNYAELRTKTHIKRFLGLYEGIIKNNIEENWLKEIEELDNIFRTIDYKIYKKRAVFK